MARTFGVFVVALVLSGAGFAQDVGKVKAAAEAAWNNQDWAGAAEQYAALVRLEPKNGVAWHHLGYALHAQGKLDDALKAHEEAAKIPGPTQAIGIYNCACVHALKGRKDQAFEALGKAVQGGFADPDQIGEDQDLVSLHEDPRWKALLGDVKAKAASGGSIRPPFIQAGTRKVARMAFFGGGKAAQLVIHHGPVAWKDEYAKAIDAPEFVGKRWRLGSDSWTTLDMNVPVTVGGIRLEPGAYYLAAEKKADGAIVLNVLDPADIRKLRLDAYQAAKTTGGLAIPLEVEKTDAMAEALEIRLESSKGSPTEGRLVIAFGPHTLFAGLKIHLVEQ